MTRRTRSWLVAVVLIAATAVYSWMTGEAWAVQSAVIAVVTVELLQPIHRYYARGSRRRKQWLLAAGALLTLAIMALYFWVLATSPPARPVDWIPWVVILAVPLVFLAMVYAAWRRVVRGDDAG